MTMVLTCLIRLRNCAKTGHQGDTRLPIPWHICGRHKTGLTKSSGYIQT